MNNEGKEKNKSFSKRKHYDFEKFWKPGMPVTEEDIKLLEEVKEFYEEHGYVPLKSEISNMQKLKSRFRTWKNVLCAAGFPSTNDAEEKRKRQEDLENKN